jgi:nitronate monooxygenase
MPLRSSFASKFALDHPIIGAPMAGGGTTPELVAAVCNAGGMGFLACAYLQPSEIAAAAERVRRLTARPFGANLFAPLPVPPPGDVAIAVDIVARAHARLGIGPPQLPSSSGFDFDSQLEAVLESRPAAFSFTFGIPPVRALERLRRQGIWILGTATCVDEATQLERAGVDAVVAQGSEAGAHRGTFAAAFNMAMVGTIALVPQVVDAVGVPVIASGGIADGRGLAAALALGAAGVQVGTALLTTSEAGIPDAYKTAVLGAAETATRTTRAFSGRLARGIVNEFMDAVDTTDDDRAILPYPLQNALTRQMRSEAARQGRPEYLSLWAGQATRLTRRGSAAELVRRIGEEAEAAIAHLGRASDR